MAKETVKLLVPPQKSTSSGIDNAYPMSEVNYDATRYTPEALLEMGSRIVNKLNIPMRL